MDSKGIANSEKHVGVLHSKISYLKNSRNRISKTSLKTIRPTAIFVQRTRIMLKRYLENVIQFAICYASEDKRQTVSAVDIAKAVRKQGHTNSDASFPSPTSCNTTSDASFPSPTSCNTTSDAIFPSATSCNTNSDESFPSATSCNTNSEASLPPATSCPKAKSSPDDDKDS